MNIRTKILYIYQTLFCAFLSLFVACDDLEDKSTSTTIDGNITETGTAEIYILSEGLFNLNNSSLAKYSFKSNKLVKNYFKDLNKRIKIGITETAPVPDSFGRAGGACTLSFGSVWKSVDCGGRVPKSKL